MPRAMRKKSESGIYHIMLRGIDRQVIFQDDEDREKYLQCLEAAKRASGFTLHAYCLMGNHLHLLLQEGKEPLELVFKRVGARYVYWYNWKYKRTGHLFQDRFKSEPVNDDAYFLAVQRQGDGSFVLTARHPRCYHKTKEPSPCLMVLNLSLFQEAFLYLGDIHQAFWLTLMSIA